MHNKENKHRVKQWNKYFRKKLNKGFSWLDIRNQLIIGRGYTSKIIELLIYYYKIEAEKTLKKRVAATILTCLLLLAFIVPMTFIKPAITGKATWGFGNTYYVDSVAGNDANDGLSPETPIKTITKVNTLHLYPGDSVLFKRGSVWRCPADAYLNIKSGDEAGYVLYSSYGSGEKPLFLGSYDLSSATNWTDYGSNIWRSTVTMDNDIGNLIFGNENSVGIKKFNISGLLAQGDFFYDVKNQRVFIYSISNPANYYARIEAAEKTTIFFEEGKNYVIYEGLSLKYGGKHGIGGENTAHVIVRNCSFSYIGGSIQFDTLRYGNGVEFLGNCNDILVEYNDFNQIYDAAITPQSGFSDPAIMTNIFFRYNLIKNTPYCVEFFNENINSINANIIIEHNTCINSGFGWSTLQGGNKGYMRLSASSVNTFNFTIKNNIFYNSSYLAVGLGVTGIWVGDATSNHNYYYKRIGSSNLLNWRGKVYRNLSSFVIATGNEVNGYQNLDGLVFVDPANNNFHPRLESGACNMSDTGSYVGALPCESEIGPLPEPFCGDLTCDADENCSTCESDCGTCPEEQQPLPICGDGECNGAENCSTCEADCGACAPEPLPEPFCGDLTCDADESCDTCASDCGECHVIPVCGDESCNGNEDCISCEHDCGTCPLPASYCGDINCDANETCSTCSSDCGTCPIISFCGDATCDANESCNTCSSDCGECPLPASYCGDINCDANETCSTCSSDCGTCPIAQITATTRRSGGGGGGGGSAATLESDWICEEWSDCIGGKQHQVCTQSTRNAQKTNTKSCKATATEDLSNQPVKEEKGSVTVPKKETLEEEQVTETPVQEVNEQVPGKVVDSGRITDYPFIVGLLSIIIVVVFMISTHHKPSTSRKGTQITVQTQEAEPDYNKELEDYYEKATKAGYTTTEIRNELLKVGWSAEVTEKLINNHPQKNIVSREEVAEDKAKQAHLGLNEPSETVSDYILKQRTSKTDTQMNNSLPLNTIQDNMDLVVQNKRDVIVGESEKNNNSNNNLGGNTV